MSGEEGSPIRLLYVEADRGDTDELRSSFEGATEFEVVSTFEIDDALAGIEDGFDCVVCEHGEPVDGIDLLERVRERDPDFPVVLVGPDDGALAGSAVEADVSGYVPRTEEKAAEILVERVRSAVDEYAKGREEGRFRMPIESLGIREELRLKERAMAEAPVGITISDPAQPDNPLIYVNDAFESLTGYPKSESVGRNCRFLQGEESDPAVVAEIREAIDRAEPVSVELLNYRKDGTQFWNRVDIAPVRNEAGEVTNYVGFQTDVTARKEAEFEVERERERLEHVLDRINGLLQDVHGDLIYAVSRNAVEEAVCERIAATDAYEFCWIGEPDLSRNTIEANAWAGSWDPDPEDLVVDLDETGKPSIVARADETGEIQVVDDPETLDAIVDAAPWIDGDLQGLAAIPLVYRETSYGVLTVYTSEAGALDERESVVLEAIGRAMATAINAIERGRIITDDDVVELEFAISDRELFFVDLAATYDTEVEYTGSIAREDGSLLLFFSTDVEPADVEATMAEHPDVEAVSVVTEHESGNLFEFTLGDGSIVARLAQRGARTRSMEAAGDTGRISIEIPAKAEPRSIVETLRERYEGTELVAYRERGRPPETKQAFVAALKDELTESQLTALQTAYASGFYEWKRPVSGDELAASMGIARSTFHQHLRAAERKVIENIFD